MGEPPQIRFSVAAMLLVTTVVALALGVAALLKVPFGNPVVQSFLAAYLIFVGVWTIIRGPTTLRNYADVQRRKRELAKQRAALADEVRQRKAALADARRADPPLQVAERQTPAQNERP